MRTEGRQASLEIKLEALYEVLYSRWHELFEQFDGETKNDRAYNVSCYV